MRWSSTPSTYMWLDGIAMMCPPKNVCSASADAWTLMLRVSKPTSPRSSTSKVILPKCMYSSFLSSVILLPLIAEIVRRSACRGSKSADAPARGVQHLDRRAAGFRRVRELGPGVRAVAVQVQRAAGDHDPAVTHA